MLSNPIALFLLNFFGHKTQNWFHEFFCTYIFQNRLSATGVLSRSSSKNSAIRTVFYFSSCEEAAALLRHLTDDRLRGVLRWTAACCCGPRVVCGFKNSFYSVELRTACHKDSPLFSFFYQWVFDTIIFKTTTYHEFISLVFSFTILKCQKKWWIVSNNESEMIFLTMLTT